METWREELYSDELYHHGIKGQRWGVRRFQNEDGSLTERGKKRYGYVTNPMGLTAAVRGRNKTSAKQLTRMANDYSKQLANDEAELRYNQSKIAETKSKLNALNENGKSGSGKAAKAAVELANLSAENAVLEQLIARNKSVINKALKNAEALELNVSSQKVLEYSERGRQMIKKGQYIGGIFGNVLMVSKATDDDRYHSVREKYKIKV